MSFQSWEKEFMPDEAYKLIGDDNPLAAAKHSLQKWIGMLPENLKKHGLGTDGSGYFYEIGNECGHHLRLTGESTCALCYWSQEKSFDVGGSKCECCPLYKTVSLKIGFFDTDDHSGCVPSYGRASQGTNVEDIKGMISDLKATVEGIENGSVRTD